MIQSESHTAMMGKVISKRKRKWKMKADPDALIHELHMWARDLEDYMLELKAELRKLKRERVRSPRIELHYEM